MEWFGLEGSRKDHLVPTPCQWTGTLIYEQKKGPWFQELYLPERNKESVYCFWINSEVFACCNNARDTPLSFWFIKGRILLLATFQHFRYLELS